MPKPSDANSTAPVAKLARPTIRFKPWYERHLAGAKAARKAERAAKLLPPQPRPKRLQGVALWAWREAQARGYREEQWAALGVPSPGLRDLMGMMRPDALPPPGEPWSDKTMARFVALASPQGAASADHQVRAYWEGQGALPHQ